MRVRADQLVVRRRPGAITIGDGQGAIVHIDLPEADEPTQDVDVAQHRLLELAAAAAAAIGRELA